MPRKKNTALPFRSKNVRFTDVKKQAFLEKYAECGRINESARHVGIGLSSVIENRKSDPEFGTAVEEAINKFRDTIEGEVHRRGVTGWEEPVFDFKNGGIMGTVRKHSDKMLEMQAKRHIPAYRPGQTEGDGEQGGVLVIHATPVDPKEWSKQFRK